MEWRPISEAPKDGTRVLLYADGRCAVGYWDVNEWSRDLNYWPGDLNSATHWMPLPPPPTGEDG